MNTLDKQLSLNDQLFEEVIKKRNQRSLDKIHDLFRKGADVNAKWNEFGQTPLHFLIDDSETVKYLLQAGADVNAKDGYGSTPLHEFCQNPPAEGEEVRKIFALLVSAGANIKAHGGEDGDTPLHLAGSDQIAQLLIEAGAGINAQNSEGKLPQHPIAVKAVRARLDYARSQRGRRKQVRMERARLVSEQPQISN